MKTRTFLVAGPAVHARTITTTRHLTFRRACLWTGFLAFATIALGPRPAQAAVTEAWVQRYQGDGLAIMPIPAGAQLRCVFQRLEGEATREGLWLSSTVTNAVNERFRIVAAAVGRVGEAFGVPASAGGASESFQRFGLAAAEPAKAGTPNHLLPRTGTVEMSDKLARFIRPGLTEEYSASMNGVRQDFIIEQRPVGAGPLRVELAVTGAKVEPLPDGARLVLENSGRKIAYSRLRVTDATGKELNARMEVASGILPDVEGAHPAARDSAADSSTTLLQDTPESAGLEAPALRQAGMPAATVLAVVVNDAEAVYPVRIDPTFSDANWISMGGFLGAQGEVDAAVVDDSGNLYIGGDFSLVGGVFANHIAKWDGSSWTALGSGRDYNVFALAVSGSDVYAGGPAGVAKWDGTNWTALGSGMGGPTPSVYALAVSGSNVYAGGWFMTAGGSAATNIAKWDGSSWSALGSGMDVYGYVSALAVSGSDLYAGGRFTTAGGSAANHIAKWNGSSWSALGSGMDDIVVLALAVSGSDLYAGGWFTREGGSAATNIAKWNGSSWTALGSGIGGGNNGNPTHVSALAVSGSDVYVGGNFTTAGGSAANYIAKWDGSSWSPLGSGMSGGFGLGVSALAVSGSDLYAGGNFTTAGGKVSAYIARAYLLTLPTLSVLRSGIPQGGIMVSWPSADTTSFTLEQAGTLAPPPRWVTNAASITDDGTNKSVTFPATNSAQFFRLRRP